ncbi:MAG: ABC transporter permease [Nitrospinota bacterium]|nr:ABC transporter permease [Nitrospinota bacterium]
MDISLNEDNRDILTKDGGRLAKVWGLMAENRLAATGLIFFIIFLSLSLFGAVTTNGTNPLFNPETVRLSDKLLPPLSSATLANMLKSELPPLGIYILGTDDLGRDIFSRMLQGAIVSLQVGFISIGISVILGVIIGGIAGFYGDRKVFGPLTVDTIIVGLIDIQLSFPTFFLILTVVALLPPSIWNIMIVIGLTGWVGPARFVRAEALALKGQDFVLAAMATGMSDIRIIFRHILPNAISPVLVSATIGIADAILTESALSFLGFGVPPPNATWGNILANGRNFIFDAPWLIYIPGIAILVTVLSFNLLGEGLRESLNPKLRSG